jgi:phage shock protein E
MLMKWTLLLFAGLLVAAVFKLKAAPRLPAETAREYLKQGARLIDVRTLAEYQAGHLANAVNIPLDVVKEELPRRVPDQSAVLLLHCRSGRRSGIAERELRDLGYTNSFNLGSYGRAGEIVTAAGNH